MKNLFATVLLVASALLCSAQCNNVQSTVSSSTGTQVQMNSNAFFVLSPGEENDIFWELRDFNDNLLGDDNTGNDFPIFVFDAPLTDSLNICQTVTNVAAGAVGQVCAIR